MMWIIYFKITTHSLNVFVIVQDQSTVSTTTQGVSVQEDPSKSRVGAIPHPSQLQLNNLTKKSSETATTAAEATKTTPTDSVSYFLVPYFGDHTDTFPYWNSDFLTENIQFDGFGALFLHFPYNCHEFSPKKGLGHFLIFR